MHGFIRWLMLANARRVFAAAVLGLAAVAAWSVWTYMRPLEPVSLPRGSGTGLAEEPSLGLIAFLNRELARGDELIPGNPFARDGIKWRRTRRPIRTTHRGPIEDGFPGFGPEANPQAEPLVTVRPKLVTTTTTRPRERVILEYKGMFKLTDGRIKALIHDSKSGGSQFYDLDSEVDGLRVKSVDGVAATLELEDGSQVPLQLGEPTAFEDGRHAY